MEVRLRKETLEDVGCCEDCGDVAEVIVDCGKFGISYYCAECWEEIKDS